MKLKHFAILAVAAVGAMAGSLAHARDGVQWSVTLASPFNLPLPPVPVITVTRPAVVAPVYAQPVYAQPVYPQPVYGGPAYGNHEHRWDERHGRDRYAHGGRGWRDADRDGIPNRYDRVYNPRGDRDGDGVPNRYDRYDRNPYRR